MGLGWLVLIRVPDRVGENGVEFQSLLFSQCLPKASIEHRPWFLLYMDCKDPPTCNLWHSRNMSYLTDLLYTLHKVCSEHCSAFSAVNTVIFFLTLFLVFYLVSFWDPRPSVQSGNETSALLELNILHVYTVVFFSSLTSKTACRLIVRTKLPIYMYTLLLCNYDTHHSFANVLWALRISFTLAERDTPSTRYRSSQLTSATIAHTITITQTRETQSLLLPKRTTSIPSFLDPVICKSRECVDMQFH